MAQSDKINWCTEDQAAELMGYSKKSIRIFTRDPKRKKLPIRTSKLNYKTILYSKTDIENFINERSIA